MKAITITENDFDQAVYQSDVPVLIDFWSTTCAPCRALAPVLDDIADYYSEEIKTVKVNITENPNIASQFKIQTLPTLSFLKNGKEVYRLTGAQSFEGIEEMVEEMIEEK